MNRRTVAKILKKKHKEFIESIEDEKVKELVDKNSIITGGSIVSLLTDEPVKDFDYYFSNKETVLAVAKYYIDQFMKAHPDWEKGNNKTDVPTVVEDGDRVKIVVQSAGIIGEGSEEGYEYFEGGPDENAMDYVESVLSDADETDVKPLETSVKKKYRPVYMSSNAITLANNVQLVIRFYGNPEDIHKNYDFVHCTNYWTSGDGHLTLKPEALESILTKEIKYQGSLYPLCSVIRARKFIQRGWRINAGQFLKMCFQISQLDLTKISVLEEQLTGVDAAYFFQVIEYCKKREAEDPEFKITTPYLVTIIDKIFG